ncbi:MFS transporter [Nocardia arthritidis]|uniref:MFS transporter n=1 Tax=Nocardia arthritidis TaxID=228602 RepID=A0A6G9YEA8_9NOCA|nr:MFS transporter [Nocardia arthritidis]QIS11615.1 MFS transporter [Nocardia arthritidis]
MTVATRTGGDIDSGVRLRLSLLAAATFIYVTYELYPVGLITAIAGDLHVSDGSIGLLVSGYAVVAAIVTIPSVALARRITRKWALLASLVALIAAELVTALATNYPMMVASRVLAALTHGVLWSLVAPAAAALVPARRVGMATAVVFAGATLASVLGSPVSTLLGHAIGWQATAVALAAVTAAVAAGLLFTLPNTDARQIDSDSGHDAPPRWNQVTAICLLALLLVFAHFVSYTYLALIVNRVLDGSVAVAAYLGLFGVAGAIATYFAGRHNDRNPQRSTVIAAGVFVVGATLLTVTDLELPTAAAVAALTAAVALWGAAYAAVGPIFQSGIIRAAGREQDRASAVYVTCYQIGIATGSACGAVVLGISVGWLPVTTLAGTVLAFLGIVRWRHAYA